MSLAAPPEEASNAEQIRWAFDRLKAGDLSALKRFWHDGTVERFPDRTCRGADEITAHFEEALEAISGFHMEVLTLAQDGEHVFVHWHLTGTHTGPVLGIEPTGKPIAIDGLFNARTRLARRLKR